MRLFPSSLISHKVWSTTIFGEWLMLGGKRSLLEKLKNLVWPCEEKNSGKSCLQSARLQFVNLSFNFFGKRKKNNLSAFLEDNLTQPSSIYFRSQKSLRKNSTKRGDIFHNFQHNSFCDSLVIHRPKNNQIISFYSKKKEMPKKVKNLLQKNRQIQRERAFSLRLHDKVHTTI